MTVNIVVWSIIVSLWSVAPIIRPEAGYVVQNIAPAAIGNVEGLAIDAAELYRLNCAGCHGIDRQGNPPTFPSLVTIKTKKSKAEIVAQIRYGKGAMPPVAHLTDAEVNAIAGYLYDEGQYSEIAVALSSVEKGAMLFKSNCAGCHRAVTIDPRPQNAGTRMCGMMEPATLSGVPAWYNKDEFARVLDKGPCYMPSFSFMGRDDKDVVYDYLATLQDPGSPRKPGRGMRVHRKGKRKRGWICY